MMNAKIEIKIPKSCSECPFATDKGDKQICGLEYLNINNYMYPIYDNYKNKRHPNCPLIPINQQPSSNEVEEALYRLNECVRNSTDEEALNTIQQALQAKDKRIKELKEKYNNDLMYYSNKLNAIMEVINWKTSGTVEMKSEQFKTIKSILKEKIK